MNNIRILLEANFLKVKESSPDSFTTIYTGTILSNLAYYGFCVNKPLLLALLNSPGEDLKTLWHELETELKVASGAHKNLSNSIVYKNFPEEALSLSDAEYWANQSLIYSGDIKSEKTPLPVKNEITKTLRVLSLAQEDTLEKIFQELLSSPKLWSKNELSKVSLLSEQLGFSLASIPFKDNKVALIKNCIKNNVFPPVKSATDILRIAVAVDTTNSKFTIPRPHRKYFLTMLNNSSSLEEDVCRDAEHWKRFLYVLHPQSFGSKFSKVSKVQQELTAGSLRSFNSKVDSLLSAKDKKVFELLSSRPGVFMRHLNRVAQVMGEQTVQEFTKCLPRLSSLQLVSLKSYLDTLSTRTIKVIPKNSNKELLTFTKHTKSMPSEFAKALSTSISKNLRERFKNQISVSLDPKTKRVKLPSSNPGCSDITKGTVFSIPANISFVRTASYWQNKTTVWFDNGWSFFDENWEAKGCIDWADPKFKKAAAFSGDPNSSVTPDNKACQAIDLYLNELAELNVRYCVWSLLCYSRVPFSSTDVYAALHWGENPFKGEIFQPSRAQLSFPVKSTELNKFVAFIDLKERTLTYLDSSFSEASIQSASDNISFLSAHMPLMIENLSTVPSVYNLFEHFPQSPTGVPVLYSDEDLNFEQVPQSYVFKRTNPDNVSNQIDITQFYQT